MAPVRLTLLALAFAALPLSAVAQDTRTPLVPEGLFSANERPSVAARARGLSNPVAPVRTPRSGSGQQSAGQTEEKPANDLEFGVEGYVWAGFSMKL